MKYSFTLILVILSLCSFAQKIRFTDTTNRWYICHNDPWMPDMFEKTTVQRLLYDTAANGKQYFRFQVPDNFDYNLITEDIAAGKVYCLKNIDSPEVLMYDYNLQPGDTLTTYALWGGDFTVGWIDSVSINGVYHKVWHFNPGGRLIEGVGFHLGPYMFEPPHPDMWRHLCCFDNKGSRPPFTGNTGVMNNTNSCMLSADDITRNERRVEVVPNPANSNSMLAIKGMGEAQLGIYNTTGQLLIERNLKGDMQIPLANIISTPGVYFYRVVNKKGLLVTGRFVLE